MARCRKLMLMAALAMAGTCASAGGALAGYSDTLLDRCWLWGHETGQVDGGGNQWKLDSATSYYHMADAARHMGLVNLNVVRWDCPDKAFRDSLKGLKRVTWPASGHSVEKRPPYPVMWDWNFKVADEMPNMAGIELDDFFMASKTNVVWADTSRGRVKVCPTVFSYEELATMRRRCDACARPLEMRLVFYDGLLAQRKEPKDLVPFIDLVTVVTYWTWKAKDIPELRENFAKYRMLAPTKPTFLGIYLYDFGDMKQMPMDMMKLQMETGLDLWRKGEIEGFVFLCSSICNRDFPAVRYAREWIKVHGGEQRRATIEPQAGETGPRFWRELVYEKPDMQPIILGGSSAAEEVACRDYCIYADLWYSDGTPQWGVKANFRQGTHGWERACAAFVPEKPVARIRVHALCRGGTGKARFRDIFLERREGKGDVLNAERRTLRPYDEAEVVSVDVLSGRNKMSFDATLPAPRVNPNPSTVASGCAAVWTADSMRLVTPLTFPTTAEISASAVSIELAKGEAESAQILVTTADDLEWKDGAVEIGRLVSAAGVEFRGDVKWERVAYLPRESGYSRHPYAPDDEEKWIPDPLLPAAPFRVRKGATQALWLTFIAAKAAAPDVYVGKVRVTEGGRAVAEVPVSVRVRGFALPETFGLETAFSLMDGFLRVRYPDNWKAMKKQAIDVMLDHRLNPDDISRTSPPEIEDLVHARKRGMNRFNILNVVPEQKDTNAKWTCYGKPDEVFTEEFYAAFTARLRPFVGELRKRDLMRYAYLYGFDERGHEYYEGIEKFWKRLKGDFPDLPLMTTAKQYADMTVGKANLPSLVSCDWYCPCTYRWNEEINTKLRARGMKIWWYTCCGPKHPYANMASYEYPLIEGRVLLGYMTYHNRADGFLFWHVNNWNESRQATIDCRDTFLPDWHTKNNLEMPGDGLFLYPATDRVLPSIRFAQLRDGVEDYEWLKLAEEKKGRGTVDALIKPLVPALTEFSRDPAAHRRARSQIGDLIGK